METSPWLLLGRSRYFSKIDLYDAINQIKLAPEESSHGLLIEEFGIISAQGYFQEIMDNLTCDLQGVAIYLDDILMGRANLKGRWFRILPDKIRHVSSRRSATQCGIDKSCYVQSSGPVKDRVLRLIPASIGGASCPLTCCAKWSYLEKWYMWYNWGRGMGWRKTMTKKRYQIPVLPSIQIRRIQLANKNSTLQAPVRPEEGPEDEERRLKFFWLAVFWKILIHAIQYWDGLYQYHM